MIKDVLRKLVVVLPVLAVAATAHADTDTQIWTPLTFNKRFDDGWRWFGEFQPRFGNQASEHSANVLRTAIGRNVGRGLTLWFGYGWMPTLQPNFRSEDRYFLQASTESRQGLWSIGHRTRLEFRQIEDTYGTTVRLRHQVKGTVRLPRMSPWFGVTSLEGHVNLAGTAGGPQPGFDQLRAVLGVGRPLSKNFTLEIGYQGVWAETPRRRHLDVLLISGNYLF